MRGRGWIVCALLCAATACATSPRRREPTVARIEIRGTDRVSPREIEKRLVTAETPWWPFARPRPFDPVVWSADLERIRRYYQARGYYEARVVSSEVIPRPGDRVALIVTVEEGPPARIEAVDVSGLEALPPRERGRVLDDLPLEAGEIFREPAWEAAKRQIVQELRGLGFAEAALDAMAVVDVGTDTARLSLAARPGVRYRFGPLRVQQAAGAAVPAAHIEEQVRLAISEGQLFSDEAIDEAQRRVFAMGVFSAARVTAGVPDPEGGTVPVLVDVREAPFRTLRLGGGVGLDQVRQELRLLSELTDRHFLGGLRRLTLQAIGGWAFIPSTYAVLASQRERGPRHAPVYRVRAELEQPRFLGRPSWQGQILLESERTLEEAYDAIGGRVLTGVAWRPTSTLVIFPAYHLQGYRLQGPRAAGAATAPLVLGCREDPCFVALSYLEEIVAWDRRDDPLEPRRGFYLSLALQQGGGPLQGGFDYLRFLPEARAYFTPGDDGVITLAAKLRVGTLLTRSGDPEDSAVVTRFYSGGSQAMRGFGIRRLSPLLLAPPPASQGPEPLLTLPIGGNGLVEGSFEARWRVSERLVAAAFLDYGAVTRRRLGAPDPGRMLYAVGLGLRYLSLVGPIRVDLGYRLPFGRPPPLFDLEGREITYRRLPGGLTEPGSETGANVNDSCFGLGGSGRQTWVRDGLCVLHISIGEAF